MKRQITKNEKKLWARLKKAIEDSDFKVDESPIGEEITLAFIEFIEQSCLERNQLMEGYTKCFNLLSFLVEDEDPKVSKEFFKIKVQFKDLAHG